MVVPVAVSSPTPTSTRFTPARVAPWLLGLVAALAFVPFVRHHSMFRDESATLYAAGLPWPELRATLARTDGIFALYYALMHGVTRVGDPLVAARLVSIAAYGGTVTLAALLGRRVAGPRGLVVAGVLTAVNPLLVLEAQTARPYALATAAVTGAVLLLVEVAQRTRGPRALWAIAVLTVLATALHLMALLPIVAVATALWVGRRRLAAGRTGADAGPAALEGRAVRGPLVATMVTLAPLFAVGALQRGQVGWIQRPTGLTGSQLLTAPAFMLTWTPRPALTDAAGLAAAVVVLGCLALLVGRSVLRGDVLARAGVAWLLAPAFLLLVVSLVTPIATRNYVSFSTPAVGLLGAVAVREGARRPAARAAVAVACALGAAGSLVMLRHPPYEDDYRSAAAYLDAHAKPGDVVVYPTGMVRAGIGYYRHGTQPVWPAGEETDLQRWDVSPTWRPPADATVWVVDFPSPFDAADLRRFEDRLVAEGYRPAARERFTVTFVHGFDPR